MSLVDIVKELGGDLYGRDRAMIPGPGHAPEDRSVSLKVDRNGRLVVTSFGRSTWQEVLDHLRIRGFIDDQKRLLGGGTGRGYHGDAAERALPAAARMRVAHEIWAAARPIDGTISERHCRLRAITRPLPGDGVLRHSAEAPLRAYEREDRRRHPALAVAIRDRSGGLVAVELTFLDRDGHRARRLKLQRKIVGVIPEGASVHLDSPGPSMLVGEGVFTTLSASGRFGLPAEAALSTSRLITWRPPEGVREVLVAGDNGAGGRRAARLLATRLREAGLKVRVAFPPREYGDFNDLERAEAGA